MNSFYLNLFHVCRLQKCQSFFPYKSLYFKGYARVPTHIFELGLLVNEDGANGLWVFFEFKKKLFFFLLQSWSDKSVMDSQQSFSYFQFDFDFWRFWNTFSSWQYFARILLVSIRVSFENQKNRCLGNFVRNCSWFLWSTLLLLFSGRCLWRVQCGNVICLHNVKSIFVSPFSSGFGVSAQRASLRGFLLVDILWYILLKRVCSSTILVNLTLVPQWRSQPLFLRATNAACNFSSPKNLVRILYQPTSGTLIILITTCISLSLFISDVDASGRIKCHTSQPLNSLLDRMCCWFFIDVLPNSVFAFPFLFFVVSKVLSFMLVVLLIVISFFSGPRSGACFVSDPGLLAALGKVYK